MWFQSQVAKEVMEDDGMFKRARRYFRRGEKVKGKRRECGSVRFAKGAPFYPGCTALSVRHRGPTGCRWLRNGGRTTSGEGQ